MPSVCAPPRPYAVWLRRVFQPAPRKPTGQRRGRTMGSTPHRAPARPRGRSAAEPTVPAGIRPERTQEVDVPEVGPVRLAEVELGGGALPEQEAAQALLAGGADDEVGIGLALGVEVPGDVVGGQARGDLLDGLA